MTNRERDIWRRFRDHFLILDPELQKEEVEHKLRNMRKIIHTGGSLEMVQTMINELAPDVEMTEHALLWGFGLMTFFNTEIEKYGKTRMEYMNENPKTPLPSSRKEEVHHIEPDDRLDVLDVKTQFLLYLSTLVGIPIEEAKDLHVPIEELLQNHEALYILGYNAKVREDYLRSIHYLTRLDQLLNHSDEEVARVLSSARQELKKRGYRS